MAFETAFEKQYVAVGTTELWKLLKDKVEQENLSSDFLVAVGEVCSQGVTKSKDIIRFFPTFTLHDEAHIVNVCKWMIRLLGEQKNNISAREAALLVMSACCHDIGMSVSVDQEKALRDNAQTLAWKEYFKQHLKDEEEFSKKQVISDRVLRNYVRTNHHKRVSEQISSSKWPTILNNEGINRNTLVKLCQSHGEKLSSLEVPRGQKYDFRLCAVLLRLADILDFDSSRAPIDLFRHLGLDNPDNFEQTVSQTEWAKNRAGVFGEIKDGIIPFTASFTSLQLEYEVQTYLDWVQEELTGASEYLMDFAGIGQDLKLPHKISRDNVERNGYRFGGFCLTMDQDRILELLTGRNLYRDPGVFVRELLQNSIDAVLNRSRLDPYFNEEDGKILIRTWMDGDGYNWFRIEDNGTGMDESIITNFFLKVGRSYYDSDEFKADTRRYGRGEDYTSISRFGIGILSCFMSDPENNLLEVSTKKYTLDPKSDNPAIRLNVTGLHGYYYMAQEDTQDENEEFFQPMHHPRNEDKGYRSEVGTTICVRVNLYQLGGYRSFKEIIDKYIQFPDVQVEYFGPEGHVIYPTQRILMDAVHSLNPDGMDKEPKEYIHTISDEKFAELKANMPDTEWTEKPSVVLKYYPLDGLSDDKNLSGVAVFGELKALAVGASIRYKGEDFSPEFRCYFENNPSERVFSLSFKNSFSYVIDQKMSLLERQIHDFRYGRNDFEERIYREYIKNQENPDWISYISMRYHVNKEQIFARMKEIQQIEEDKQQVELYNRLERRHYISISYDDLISQMSEEETSVFQYVIDALQRTKTRFSQNEHQSITVTAYKGILADSSNLLGKNDCGIGLVVLLGNEYRPGVNLARDMISDLPLEAACSIALVKRKLPELSYGYSYDDMPEPFHPKQYVLLPEQEIKKIFEKYPNWEKQFFFYGESISDLRQSLQQKEKIVMPEFSKKSLYDFLALAILKQNFAVYKNTMDRSSLYITKDVVDDTTTNFPVSMFIRSANADDPFGYINIYSTINYYNREHRFSRWLIQHQEELQNKVPGIYNNLLRTMLLSKSKLDVIEAVNSTLVWLKGFRNNLFEVSDELLLKNDDLRDSSY